LRSTGYGIAAAAGKVGAFIAVQGFSSVASSTSGIQIILYIFAAWLLFGSLCSVLVPETRGKSLEEVVQEIYTENDNSAEHTSNTNNTESSAQQMLSDNSPRGNS